MNAKEEKIIALVADKEVQRLTERMKHNWEVAQGRMVQMVEEREAGYGDDKGVELMPVYCRMERVYADMLQLAQHAQAYLLPSVVESLKALKDDNRIDNELVSLMCDLDAENAEEVPDFWGKLMENKTANANVQAMVKQLTTILFMQQIVPNVPTEGMQDLTEQMSEFPSLLNATEQPDMASTGLPLLGRKLSDVANSHRMPICVGLLVRKGLRDMVIKRLDLHEQDDAIVSQIFEKAKTTLMESEAWHDYWGDHKRHLEQLGPLDEQWKQDEAETERWLLNMHGYLYNDWNEGPEAFGKALKRERLNEQQMLQLLFYLAKKDAIALDTEAPDLRREKMETNVLETALKMQELAGDKYYDRYEDIWQKIVKSEALSEQLLAFNSSKYNKGFNMMCLCKIVGYLHREYHFYGCHTPEDMGKFLGDKYVKNSFDTFSNYIKKKETMLNDQCFKELDSIVKNLR